MIRPTLLVLVCAGCAIPGRPRNPGSLYRAGQFQRAYDGFHTLIEQRGADPRLVYDAGLALYRLGRYDEAAASFETVTRTGGPLGQRAWYNLGTTWLTAAPRRADRVGRLRQAVTAFIQALALDPRDDNAKWNLELAEQRLAEAAIAMSPGPTHRADWGAGNLTKSGYAGQQVTTGRAGGGGGGHPGVSAPRLTPEQARRLLSAFRAQAEQHPERTRLEDSVTLAGQRDW